jgi:hypothetical protein
MVIEKALGFTMIQVFLVRALLATSLIATPMVPQINNGSKDRICLVASGLGGMPEYEDNFLKWSDSFEELCRTDLDADVIRLRGSKNRRTDFENAFKSVHTSLDQGGECWIVLIGHGSFDGRDYKFNIAGPDLLGKDLVRFLEAIDDRRTFTILATSSSGGMASLLKAPNRVVITATKSEREKLAPLFMSFFLEAARSAEADLDKNGLVSLNEAFTFSEDAVSKWYESKNRLQTEHPILEGSDLARTIYLSEPPEQAYRTLEARKLIPERIRLEREVEELKLRKTEMGEMEYFSELERLLVELAELNEKIRKLEGEE